MPSFDGYTIGPSVVVLVAAPPSPTPRVTPSDDAEPTPKPTQTPVADATPSPTTDAVAHEHALTVGPSPP